MKIVIEISDYNREWIKNAYAIPEEINTLIAESIINGEPLEHRCDTCEYEYPSCPSKKDDIVFEECTDTIRWCKAYKAESEVEDANR